MECDQIVACFHSIEVDEGGPKIGSHWSRVLFFGFLRDEVAPGFARAISGLIESYDMG